MSSRIRSMCELLPAPSRAIGSRGSAAEGIEEHLPNAWYAGPSQYEPTPSCAQQHNTKAQLSRTTKIIIIAECAPPSVSGRQAGLERHAGARMGARAAILDCEARYP